MAAIEKTFYGNSSAQKVKAKNMEANGTVSSTAGLLWGFSANATGAGVLSDNTTPIAYVAKNAVWFDKPVAFDNSLKLTGIAGKLTVYYE